MKKIGIFGGTFNPIHSGHLILAETAFDAAGLDEVWFIPSGCSYMKPQEEILPGQTRLEMARQAVLDNPNFKVLDVEVKREGYSYTCETFGWLLKNCPDTEFYYIVGADTLFSMEKWKEPEKIFASSVVLAAVRGDADMEALYQKADDLCSRYKARIKLIPSLQIEISSTQIRKKAAEGNSIRYLVPEAVRTYIEDNKLYRSNFTDPA